MNVCILGCGGFVGSHLTERLLSATEHRVVGVDLTSAKIEHLVGHSRLEFHERDVSTADDARGFVAESDVVVHLAAICNPALYNTRPLDVIDANFTRALPVVRLCTELDRWLVYYSTCEVYGKTVAGFALEGSAFGDDPANYVMTEDASPLVLGPVARQRWTYSCAKQLAERVIYAEGAERGLRYTILRPFNFVGPRMDFLPGVDGEGVPRVFPLFMKALLADEPLLLVDGGRARRTFLHVREATDAFMRVLKRPEECRGQILNVGNPGNETTIRGLAELMADIFTEKTGLPRTKIEEVDSRDFYGEGYDDCDRRVPDVAKAEALLDWRPEVPLRELLAETMGYYIDKYRVHIVR
jgi:UDP-apiose/xylose synthase